MPDAPPVPLGIAAPQVFFDGPVDMALVREFVCQAESLGYHSLWVQENIIGTSPVLEPLGLLSYMAAITENIKLGSTSPFLSLADRGYCIRQRFWIKR